VNTVQDEYIYSLTGVSKFAEKIPIIQDITLCIKPEEKVAILGPSGVGKTTLIRLMSGEIHPDSGTVKLNGQNSFHFSQGRELARIVGVINQQFNLVDELSVMNNVLAGNLGRWNFFESIFSLISSRNSEIAQNALSMVDLSGRDRTKVSKLSGGEQQRVAIARLIVQDPAVILADEPVSSLDPARAEEIMNLLLKYVKTRSKTLVAVLHSFEFTKKYFDRVIGIREGAVYFDISTNSLTQNVFEDLYI
jgi:phosphonate transport system ATP-binding protein